MALWPLPQHLDTGSTTLWLSPDVQYAHHVNSQPLRDETPWYKGLEKSHSSVLIYDSRNRSCTDLYYSL